MKKGFKLIVPSFLAIIVCVLLVTASTYALFTSDATVNLSVGSATVKVSAEVTNMKTYSITHENTGNFDEAGTIQDGDFAATYYYALQEEGKFAVGGTASFANGTLTLDKMVPGDKVTFTLDSANQSNVDVKYRLSIEATENSSEALLSVLQFKIGNETIRGLKNYYTEWFNSADTALTDTNFEILFPLNSGNTFQTKTVGYSITLQAVQANAKTSGEKNYETIDLYVEEVKSTAQAVVAEQATNVQIDVPSVEIDNTNLSVSASIPADNTYKDADDQPMIVSSTSLKVSDLFVQTNSLTNETSIAADVKLLDQDGNEIKSVHEDKPVTVTVYVGKGFNSVKVKHNGVLVEGSQYDPDEGTVTFETASFSPFEFIGDFAALIGTTYYGTLKAAIEAWQPNQEIVVLKDIQQTASIVINKSVSIDGANHTLTMVGTGSSYAFNMCDLEANAPITINVKDLTIKSTSNQCVFLLNGDYPSYENPNVFNATNLNITTDGEAFYSNGPSQINVYNCSIKHEGQYLTGKDAVYYSALIVGYNGTLNVYNSTISSFGNGASSFPSGGTINLYNTKITAFDDLVDSSTGYLFWARHEKSYDTGNWKDYCGSAIINVYSGQYSGPYKVTDNGQTELNRVAAINLYGGTYVENPSEYVAEGYEAVQNADGTWTVAHSE